MNKKPSLVPEPGSQTENKTPKQSSISSLEEPGMDRGEEEIKYVLSITFPDLPIIPKLGRPSLASEAEKGNIERTLILETRVKIKMAQHGGRTESSTWTFKGAPWKAATAEKRWEVKHRQPKSQVRVWWKMEPKGCHGRNKISQESKYHA